MRKNSPAFLEGLALAFVLTCGAGAQTQTIKIWPGVAPGSENWTQSESVIHGTDSDRVVNIVTPTLTIYLPEKSKATGTGVIIAPGGGFTHLTIDKEGYRVASWLQERGIAGFVLKYRLRQMTAQEVQAAGAGARSVDNVRQYGMADGIQALKVLRQRAQEFGVSPDKIGIVGFSAGGMVASAVLLQEDPAARPAFAAPIYGAPFGTSPSIPQNLPPVFLAWAEDDRTAGTACGRFYEALKAAGAAPEVHIYQSGGHGFGMSKQGKTSDHWIDEFYYWLEAQGFTTKTQ
jgi:acetyl esterase/lipase